VVSDVERVEIAAFADLARAVPSLCDVAEIDGGVCTLLRGSGERQFNRAMGSGGSTPSPRSRRSSAITPGG
jgi:hypothetical protein